MIGKAPRRIPRPALALALLPLAYFLYFFGLTAAGMVGPDEPRYASIGREMARSGDWITPRLWGQTFFEKPALLYWMTGAAFRMGLGPDLAPRLPVALMSVAFLAFYWWMLRREFGCAVAWFATLILSTSAGWWAYSQSGVTDLPLSAAFGAAMLLALPWAVRRDPRLLPYASAMFGLAVLAKGPAPLVLAAPLAIGWRGFRDLLRLRVVVPFLLFALPWYVLCYLRNGTLFLHDFFWVHNFERYTTKSLQHGQPWWFFVPVLALLLLPWTALAPLAAIGAKTSDRRRLYLLLWTLWPVVFFSIGVNKLPGYILPMLPAVAALIALGLIEARSSAPYLALTALLLAAYPVAAPLLEAAIKSGLSRAPRPGFQPLWLAPVAVAALVWFLDARGRRLAAVACLAVSAAAGMVYLKLEMGRTTFARSLWNRISDQSGSVCVASLDRSWRYGLNYYSVVPLPDCSQNPKPLHVMQGSGRPPELIMAVDPH
jgi:4-amino-4-deoxy-L-arabinose transferase-like glycosyltransferase